MLLNCQLVEQDLYHFIGFHLAVHRIRHKYNYYWPGEGWESCSGQVSLHPNKFSCIGVLKFNGIVLMKGLFSFLFKFLMNVFSLYLNSMINVICYGILITLT